MNCYFCQNPLERRSDVGGTTHDFYNPCATYSNQGDILNVYTNQKYVSFYIGDGYKIIELKSSKFFTPPSYMEIGRRYQIRLSLKDNVTDIIEVYGESFHHIMQIPGFPFNLKNAKDKLKLYLTFS